MTRIVRYTHPSPAMQSTLSRAPSSLAGCCAALRPDESRELLQSFQSRRVRAPVVGQVELRELRELLQHLQHLPEFGLRDALSGECDGGRTRRRLQLRTEEHGRGRHRVREEEMSNERPGGVYARARTATRSTSEVTTTVCSPAQRRLSTRARGQTDDAQLATPMAAHG